MRTIHILAASILPLFRPACSVAVALVATPTVKLDELSAPPYQRGDNPASLPVAIDNCTEGQVSPDKATSGEPLARFSFSLKK